MSKRKPSNPPTKAPSFAQDARAERFRERIREFRRIRAGDVESHPNNPRLHSAAQLAAVTGLLVDVGKFRPLIAFPADGLGSTGDFSRLMYADGHGRRAIDPDEVWTFAVTDLTRAEADEALFADRTGELAGYDPVILDSLMHDVSTGCAELQQMLDDLWSDVQADAIADTEPADPVDAEPQTDRAAALQEQWQTAAGQLWLLGKHRLLCGDSTKPEDVARAMGGEKASAVVTDPPYGIGWDTDYTRFTTEYGTKRINHPPVINDDKEFDPTPLLGFEKCVLWGANWYCKNIPIGSWLIWDKRHPNGTAWLSDAEIAWMKGGKGVYIYAETVQGAHRKERSMHPTQKPVGLMCWCIEKACIEDLIFEPYCGSGTTLIAAENLGRRCFGLEISPEYCAVILQRYRDAFGDQEIRQAP